MRKPFAGKKKLSYRELQRKYLSLKKDYELNKNAKKADFEILYLLAVKLYIENPDDEIFHNQTMKDDFMDIIKKGAKEMIKNKESSNSPEIENKDQGVVGAKEEK